MEPIAHIENDLTDSFAVPRQSGLVTAGLSRIVFEPAYRIPEALRGIEEYSHLWLIWSFSLHEDAGWTPTVRPPKLGGNTRLGVFATRSPFRPNGLGLSCVRLEAVTPGARDGALLTVSGADLMNGTPIFDIKPYLPYADAHPEASGSFGEAGRDRRLTVELPVACAAVLPDNKKEALLELLSLDPRPGYHHDEDRVYGFHYGSQEVRFRVSGDTLTVLSIQ